MIRARRTQIRELLFRVSVAAKGVDALLDVVGGIALLIVTPGFILQLVGLLAQDELAEDPRDLVANYALSAARRLSLGTEHFTAFYLLSHGVIKLLLVAALLKNKLWAYPWAVVIFGAFIIYQLYRFTFTHAMGLIALSVFDLGVIWLVWLEYRSMQRSARY